LRALVDSPLMLHIMSATYRDVAADEVAAGQEDTVAARRIRLFNDFVQRMFKRKVEAEKPYSDAHTTTWLSWLARRMEQHNQTTFLIEELQPSWLPAGGWQWAYMLTSRFIVSLLGGWLGGSIIGLGLVSSESTSLALALQRGLVEGVIGGLITGAVVGLVDIAWIARLNQRPLIKTMSPVRQSLLKILLVTLIVTIMVALLFTLTFGAIQWLGGDRTDWLFEGMSVGLVFGLSAALVFAFGPKGIRDSLANDIHTVERLSWSLTGAMPGGLIGVAIGALTGAIAGVVAQDTPTVKPLVDRGLPTATIAVTMMLIGAVIVGLIGFIFGGLTGTFLKIEKVTPNQGLRLSLVNSLMTGSLIGLLFAGLGLLLGEIVGSAADALTYGIYGLFIGFLASLWYGGFFLLQHSGLRLMLWARGDTPPPGKLADFLDYAAQRIFLRKIGGGYIFLHRYLLEHFAGLSGP
jgi:hypothetical protein